MPATTSYVALWEQLVESRCREAGAGLLVDLFCRLAREEREGGGAALREELATIVRDTGDGSMINEWLMTLEAGREELRDVARNWTDDSREV